MSGPIITLLTDFGVSDAYVGAMKGVMLSIRSDLTIVDISHEVGPQDVLSAAILLPQYAPFYPPGSVHMVVVDPGVGTDRKALAIRTERCFLVGPDNGVFSQLLQSETHVRAVEITNPELMLPEVSRTFHGRDIFAPAAAHLASGVPLAQFGSEITDLVQLEAPLPVKTEAGFRGRIVRIDRFGNAITDIPQGWFTGQSVRRILVKDLTLEQVQSVYGGGAEGEAIALFSGSGMLEIAIGCGSVAEECGLVTGDEVVVEIG